MLRDRLDRMWSSCGTSPPLSRVVLLGVHFLHAPELGISQSLNCFVPFPRLMAQRMSCIIMFQAEGLGWRGPIAGTSSSFVVVQPGQRDTCICLAMEDAMYRSEWVAMRLANGATRAITVELAKWKSTDSDDVC